MGDEHKTPTTPADRWRQYEGGYTCPTPEEQAKATEESLRFFYEQRAAREAAKKEKTNGK